ncbi:MAG: sugar ABC transporter substrate-binding protein [Armatimonadota bacterium]|nr:MAG: sugar ABC transporter substrate-binding protein [Armatimonadota bacterium]
MMLQVRTMAIVAAAGLMLTGCAREATPPAAPEGESGTVIGGLGKSIHPFWDQVEKGMRDAAEPQGIQVEFYVPTKEDARKQAEKIKSWVAVGVSGILFAASDPETVGPAIKDATARNIPCVAMDTDAPDSGRLAYVGTDNYEAGKVAARVLGDLLKGKGKVCIATGSLTASNSLERIRGFKEVLAKDYPGITVLPEILVDNEDRAVAEQKAKAKIAAEPDLAAFFGVYALNGPACANAVKGAGKQGKIRVVCFDTTAEHMNMLKSGMIDAAVGQRPYLMGKKGLELLALVIKKGPEEALKEMGAKNGSIDTGVDVVRREDVEEYRARLKDLGIPVEGW